MMDKTKRMADGSTDLLKNFWKTKYYVRQSFNYLAEDWWAVCQTVNNVVIAECPEREIAELICDILNALPDSVIGRVKVDE